MSCIVPRTCTRVLPDDAQQKTEAGSQPLADFRTVSAYVLLGDPGSGKSTSFEAECDTLGDEACLVPARDFLAFNSDAHPEWHGRTLFIDGLDEVRAGGGDARTPFDALRGRLDALGRPRFRLSCREADWLGTNDRMNLAKVSPDADLTVLRLDPLAEDDIERILNARSGIDDVRSFITTAKEKGVAGLLANPQCLTMLADVVTSGGGWPEGRLQLFEQACRLALREHSEEHRAAERVSAETAPEGELLDAAGRLCALLLISGAAGCATAPDREDADYPDLSRSAREYPVQGRQLLCTKLFTAVAEGRFRPVHRHVAEFLAGRYLARLIDGEERNGRRGRQGIPARRVVALMTGHDGEVVTALRGLSARVAALCRSARNEFIERDPIGVGLYGDIGEFSLREKRDLLASLERTKSRLRLNRASGVTAAFAPLATSAMQPAIGEILRSADREPQHQSFVGLLLDVLCHGSKLSGLADAPLAIVSDDTWSPPVNALALRAFLHHCPDGAPKTNRLKTLLADVHAGLIPDPNEDLTGLLLSRLFPRDVPPSEVWRYLTAKEDPGASGSSWRFWSRRIPDESSDEQVIQLLDGLVRQLPEVRTALETRDEVEKTPTKLLARALHICGDTIDVRRLYDWLSVGVVAVRDGRWIPEDHESVRVVRLWLESRPEVREAVLMEGLSRCVTSTDFWRQAFDVRKRLYGARRPSDYGIWCLRQAVSLADTRLQVAEYLLWEAFRAHGDGDGNVGLSLDVMAEHVGQNEKLKPGWDWVTRPPRWSDDGEDRRRYKEDQQQREEEWLAHVRSKAVELEENRAAPVLLFQMARAYFGDFVSLDAIDGPKRVEKLLRGDPDLIRAALAGLRGTIGRPDVPEIHEILDVRKRNRTHYLARPFLAGLAEMERTSPGDASRWHESRMGKALVFYFCYMNPNADYSPKWYGRLLEKRPEVVAGVLTTVAAFGFRDDGSDSAVFWALAHDRSHAQVARLASLRLLDAFPIRCTAEQLGSLDCLLRAALQYADKTRLLELVDGKLQRRSMNISQRLRWLACGGLVAPRRYDSRLRDFVEGRERRARHVADFLFPGDPTPAWRPHLDNRGLELFISLLAPYADPDSWSEAGVVTPAMWASIGVSGMMGELAALPDEDATRTLKEMAAEPRLFRWRPALLRARNDQLVVLRDAAYRHPDVDQICRALDDGPPANAADLAALVTDRLGELGDRIRNGNTDDWRQYWNEDQHGRPCKPKHEESCRDALLSDLRQCLPDEVDAQPEGHYGDDKRADIRISCRDFQVPVEIKKNSHKRLWSALRDQLIVQYARDPATDGYAIYLVLWFGEIEGHRTPPPPSGVRPDAPETLKARLEEVLTPEEARKISVCVIDVSAPAAKPQ